MSAWRRHSAPAGARVPGVRSRRVAGVETVQPDHVRVGEEAVRHLGLGNTHGAHRNPTCPSSARNVTRPGRAGQGRHIPGFVTVPCGSVAGTIRWRHGRTSRRTDDRAAAGADPQPVRQRRHAGFRAARCATPSCSTTYLEGAGVGVERFESRPGPGSIVARIEGTDPTAPTLCLMGHTDVVPVNPAGWSRDPFGGELIDGEVWGRGAIDMLNITASMAVAFRQLATQRLAARRAR